MLRIFKKNYSDVLLNIVSMLTLTRYMDRVSTITQLLFSIAVNELTLTLDATYYHVRVTTEQLQEENKYTVLTIAFSRPLLEGEVIEDSAIVGQNVKFELNSSTLTVHPISSVSPGRHSMDIAVVIGSHLLSAPLTVDVIAEGNSLSYESYYFRSMLPC